MQSNVFVYHDKYQEYSDKQIDWFIKSFKFTPETDEWKICRIKSETYEFEALKYLELFLAGIEEKSSTKNDKHR